MIFQSILNDFQIASNGTDAFKQLKYQCEEAIQNSDHFSQYCVLFLIYGFAKNYVLLYEDEAVTSEFAIQAKQQLIAYMLDLNQAMMTQDAQIILDCLNEVVKIYSESSRVF